MTQTDTCAVGYGAKQMDLEGRIDRLEESLKAVELKIDELFTQQRDLTLNASRHPDLIKRAHGSTQAPPSIPPVDRRFKGACLAIAMVMVIIVVIAAITTLSGLGQELSSKFEANRGKEISVR